MLWQTSPAATELETKSHRLAAPSFRSAGRHSKAASKTPPPLRPSPPCLVMRERALGFTGNQTGLSGAPRLRVYCSAEAHTSIDRAIWFSGIGADNLVRIPIKGPLRGADPDALRRAHPRRHRRRLQARRHHRQCRRHRRRRHRSGRRARRHRARVRSLSARRRRLGRCGDDLPGISSRLGRRRRRGLHRRQPAQMAGRANRIAPRISCAIPPRLTRTLAARPDYLHTLGRAKSSTTANGAFRSGANSAR